MKPLIKNFNLKFFKKNLVQSSRQDFSVELEKLQNQIYDLKVLLWDKLLLRDILSQSDNEKYELELHNLHEFNQLRVFPYKQLRLLDNVVSGLDSTKGMPFVIHAGKHLYFPKSWTQYKALSTYKNYIEVEGILGGNYSEKMPHQYQSEDFCVEDGDVFLDIGSAEALFSLDIIDRVKKVYIFESDSIWFEPLNATFEPYKSKVEIITKHVSDFDDENHIKLSTALRDINAEQLFLKFDIEGSEEKVLKDIEPFLKSSSRIKIACCLYHKKEHEKNINQYFEDLGFTVTFSDGYMLFYYDKLEFPFFRKGLLRASKGC